MAASSVGLGAILAVALIVLSLLWIGSSMQKRACVEQAAATYPAVPVSAFSGRDTGPLKVSFVRERAEAVDGCGIF
jgi:hypothetical protein